MALTAEQLRKNREERNKKTDLIKRMNPSTFVSNLETVINTAQDVNNNWKTPEELEDARNVFAGFLPQAKAFAEYDKVMNPGNQFYNLSKDYKSSGMSYRDFKLNHDLPTAIDNHYTNSPTSIHAYVQNVMNSLGAIGERNAKYKTADAYNEAQANIKKYEAMTVEELEADKEKKKSRNVPTTTSKQSNLEAMFGPVVDDVKGLFGFGDEEKKDTSNIAYNTADGDVTYDMLIDNRKRRDFEENITSKSDFEEKNKSDDDYTGKRLMAPSVEEAIYYTVNGALARKDLYTKKDQDRITNAHYVDEKQRGIFNYLWETEGSKSALAYFDMIEPTLEKERNADFQQTMYNFGKNHEILGTLASLGTNLFSGAEAVGNSLNYAITGDLDTNQLALATSAMRSGVSDSVDWNIGNWDAFDFVYNSTMSGVDSFLSTTTFGGVGGAVNLGLSAAAQGTNDALERGFSNKDAFWDGFISGILEATFEYVSIGQFNALKEGTSDGLKTAFKNIGKSMLVNASEETLTELANIAYDYISNGDFSQWEADIRKYMAQGMSESEAKNKVARENGARVLEAGASGAFMGIGFGSVSQYSSYKNAKALGTTIRGGGTTSQVFDAASQMTPEEMQKYDAYTRYAKKGINAENIKDAQLGNLYNQTQQAYGQRVTDAQKALDKETKPQTKRLAEIDSRLEAHKQGKSHLEAGERRALRQEREDIVSAMESSEAKASYEKAVQDSNALTLTGIESAFNYGLKKKADAKKKEFEKEQKANFKAEEKRIKKSLGDFNIGSETKVTDAEGTAKVQGIKVDGENFSVVLDNGESVSVDKMTFSKSDADLIASAEQIATTEGTVVANAFIKNYDGKSDINEYRNTFEQMAIYTKGSFTNDYILKQMNGKLSTEQFNSIYSDLVTAPRKAQQEALDKLVGEIGTDLGDYSPTIDDSIIDYDGTGKGKVKWSSLDTRQRDAITFVKAFAKMIGANVTFTESTYNEETKKREGENGSYDKKTNTITIDVYAGIKGFNVATSNADSIISTFSHELTHWMKEKSPELYHKIGDKIIKLVGEKNNLTEEELIYREMARLEKAHKGKKFTHEDCRDEIIARGCEDMLSMSQEGRRMFESMSETEQKGFIAQVKALLNKLLEWVNNLLNGYKSNSDEAVILRSYEAELQELSKMWDEMLTKSVETNKALESKGITGEKLAKSVKNDSRTETDNKSGEGGVQYDDREEFNKTCDALENISDEEYNKAKVDTPFILVMDYTPKLILDAMKEDDPNISMPANNRKILIRRDALYLAIRGDGAQEGHYHELGAKALKKLPEYLENPDAIIRTNENNQRRLVLSHINAKNGQAIISVEFESSKDFEGKNDYFNVIITVFDLHEGYLKKLFKKNEAVIKYEKEDLMQVNPQLYKWLRTFNTRSSKESIPDSQEKSNEQIVNNENVQNADRYEVTELTDDDYGNMKKHFGVTGNYNVAGYLLKSGHMLDFSGKHWGNTTSRTRQVDHREISEVLPDESNGVGAMVNMISNGNIRLMPEVGGVNLAVKPSKNQRVVLRRYIEWFSKREGIVVDIDAVGGDTIKSFEYDKGVSADRVMRDIDNYFKGGTTSELMQFHESDDVQYSDRAFSYNELVSKGSIQGVIINNSQQVKLTSNGSIDVKWVIDEVRKKCRKMQTKSSSPTYYIEVLDIGKNVVIDRESIEHNLRKSQADDKNDISPKALLNARVSLELPEILKHSIEVNRSVRSGNLDVPYSHVMLGTAALEDANGNLEYYAVRLIVEERVNQDPILAEAEILGRLYAINTKKVDHQRSGVANNSVARLQGKVYTYNIAELLKNVKNKFKDTFSNDVYANLGMQRTNNDFSKNLQFQDRNTESIYDIMGESEKLKRTNELLKADIESLKELVKLERKLTHGKVFKGVSLEAVANHLIKKANSTIDKKTLMTMLNDEVYSFIVNSTEEDWAREDFWAEVQQRSYNVASKIVAEAKTQTMIDDYPKMILKDIRSTPIWLSEGQKAELEHRYGSRWHDRLFGKVKTTTDSKYDLENKWREWAEQYPDIFPKDTNEAEMGIELIETYDRLREASEITMEFDTEEATRSLMAEVYNQYWNLNRFESTADKYNKRIKELQASHKKAMTELRDSYKERIDKQKLADEMYYGRKANDLKKDHEAKLREQRKADKEKATALIKNLRDQRDEGIAEAKRVGRERMSNYRTELERKRRIQSITANTLALGRKLLKNSKEEHIPEVMKPVIVDFVNALDFSSKRMLDKGVPTKKDVSLYKALERVKDMMAEANANKEAYAELAGIISDEDIKKLVDSAWNIKEKLGDNEFVLNNMSVERLESLDYVVKALKHIVNQVNNFYVANHAKGITSLAQETMSEMNSLGKAKLHDGLRARAIKMLEWGNAVPYYAFKRFGEGGKKIFEAFQDGWDKFAFNIKEIVDYANETYTDKEVKEWAESVKTFKILVPATDADLSNPEYKPQYQEVQMTVPQIMSLYALQKREQAKGHMLGGGIRIADFENKKGNIVSQTEGAVLTQKDIDSIVGTLTDRQKAVADKLQKFMNTVCSDWGNYVSMTRFGYEAFGEENYFPIQSDDNNLAVNDATEQNNSLFRLLNMSFSKSLTENANNRIVISDIFDVFAQHTSDMAKYNALALPVLDAFRWYNYTEKAEAGDTAFTTNGVKQSIETAFGKDAQNYITTFLKDINGTQEVSRDTLGKGFYTKAKIAAVGANLRVVLLQPTSYLRANAVIDPKYLARAFAHKPNIEYAEKYCGIALWKSMGYYDTNVQKGVEDLIKHNKTFGDKATDIAMKGAEWADKITWGYLWNACEIEIRETRSDLKSGSEEFFIEVGKRLREVIYATQVVDSTMTRSQMMRSSDGWDKMLTAFASEPTLSYNMLMDAYMGYSLDAKKMGKMEAIKKNGKRIARIVFAYTVTNALAALVESGFDALRDDDDEEKDGAYFMSLYLENFANDMSITAKIPYIKEMHSILKGFRPSRTDTQWMETFIQTAKALEKDGLSVKSVKSAIKTISYVSGLPFYNAYRDAMAGLDKTKILTAEDLEKMFSDFID